MYMWDVLCNIKLYEIYKRFYCAYGSLLTCNLRWMRKPGVKQNRIWPSYPVWDQHKSFTHPEAIQHSKTSISLTSLFSTNTTMGFRLPSIRRASFTANKASSQFLDVPKGYVAVYVGERMKRFLIPISYLNQPSF
ncbi:hypothetical protein RIF29_15411 [Crotalaria pallida]|uniref:Uncharacterized protein n=1 Tax=Crotalaria pallida TaxID=3830 RepID=A0AAN9IB58_CROPI